MDLQYSHTCSCIVTDSKAKCPVRSDREVSYRETVKCPDSCPVRCLCRETVKCPAREVSCPEIRINTDIHIRNTEYETRPQAVNRYKHRIRNTVIRNTEPAPKGFITAISNYGFGYTYNKNKKKTQPLIIA